MDSFTRRVTDAGGRVIASDPMFDLSRDCPELTDALARTAPHVVEIASVISKRLPLSPGVTPLPGTGIFRLPGHHRSLCFALRSPSHSLFDSDVIIWKGTEPLLPDYPEYLSWMTTARLGSNELPMSELVPLTRGGVPAGQTYFEAAREWRLTVELHQLHLRHYGELAHAPVPLIVHRCSDDDNIRCHEILASHLSGAAVERADPRLRKLLVSVFYYPSAPIRANYYVQFKQLNLPRTPIADPEAIIGGWIQLFVRMLHLGYMPFAPWGMLHGSCFDPGNAVIDGGVMDCDSIVPVTMLKDDFHFFHSLVMSIDILRRSIASVLQVSGYESDMVFLNLAHIHVVRRLTAALERESRPDLILDPRVRHCLQPDNVEVLTRCMSAPSLSTVPYATARIQQGVAAL